jgi:MFS family permease
MLLGMSKCLTWSTTVIMKIDLTGRKQRGLTMGLNEFSGYFAVAGSALATGWIDAHYGLPAEPFYLVIVYAFVCLLLSLCLLRETQHHVTQEWKMQRLATSECSPRRGEIFHRASLTDRNLSSDSQAGLVNNLSDGMA